MTTSSSSRLFRHLPGLDDTLLQSSTYRYAYRNLIRREADKRRGTRTTQGPPGLEDGNRASKRSDALDNLLRRDTSRDTRTHRIGVLGNAEAANSLFQRLRREILLLDVEWTEANLRNWKVKIELQAWTTALAIIEATADMDEVWNSDDMAACAAKIRKADINELTEEVGIAIATVLAGLENEVDFQSHCGVEDDVIW